jgi:predicted nucleic acid-binding protein
VRENGDKCHVEFSGRAVAPVQDLRGHAQPIHRPAHADLLKAAQLERRYRPGWWNALIPASAIELGCAVLWTEDPSDGRRLGPLTVRNPFR